MAPVRLDRRALIRIACVGGCAIALAFYGLPMGRTGSSLHLAAVLGELNSADRMELAAAAIPTLILAITCSLAAVCVGLAAAIALTRARPALQRWTSGLLLLPFFLGESTLGFLMRRELDLHWRSVSTTDWPVVLSFLLFAALQTLRLGGLFAFVFAGALSSVPSSELDFVRASRLDRRRVLLDVLFPRVRAAAQVCACMAFAATMVESTTMSLVFRASPGNGLEMLTHWMDRKYDLLSRIDPQAAREFALASGATYFVIIVTLGAALFLLSGRVAAGMLRVTAAFRSDSTTDPWRLGMLERLAVVLLGCYAAAIVIGVLLLGWRQSSEWNAELVKSMVPYALTVLLGLLAGFVATAGACVIAMLCLVAWPRALAGATPTAIGLLSGFVLIAAVPLNYLTIMTYDWAFHVLGSSGGAVGWFIAHCALVLPLLTAFYVATHFGIRSTEMDFQWVQRIGLVRTLWVSFFRRYWAVYALGTFCTFALVWNEHTVNEAFASSVPSFASALNRALEGRSTSVGVASACCLLSLAIGLCCVVGLSRRTRAGGPHS